MIIVKNFALSILVIFLLFGCSQKQQNSSVKPLVSSTTGKAEMPKTIMLGTVYDVFNERYDTDKEFQTIFDRDIKLIKETGINTILPFPLGEWQGSTKTQKWGRSDYMIKGIEDNDFMFIPMLVKSQHNAYFPGFMQSKAKNIFQEMNHVPDTDYDEIKFNRTEVKDALDSYMKSIVERYGNSPSLVGYNIWNEPHFESMDDITVHEFQQWLKTKYGTIDNFNKAWATTNSDWSEISPLARNTWPSSMCYIDWHLFRYWYVGQLVKWSVDVLHKYDTKHFAYASPVLHQLTTKSTSLWFEDGKEIIPYTDALAFSFYPDLYYDKDKDIPMGYWKYNEVYTASRSDAGDKPYFLNEAQTNSRHGFGLSEFMTYNKIYMMTWLAFSENAKGIVYWQWQPFMRGQQAFGRGLTQTNGKLAKRGVAVKDIGAVVKEHGELLYKARLEKPKAGILISMPGMLKTMEMCTKNDVKGASYFMHQSFDGTYKALWEENIPVDVIRIDKEVTLESISDYKILYLPFQIMVSPKTAGILKQYVANGGWLVADAKSVIMDEHDFGYDVNPGAGLDKVFGATREDFINYNGNFDIEMTNNEYVADVKNYKGAFYKDFLTVYKGAEVLASFKNDSSPALVANKYGKGLAVLSAVPLGGSYIQELGGNAGIITSLAKKANAGFDIKISANNEVVVKLHRVDDGLLVYVINTGDKDFKGNISFENILSEKLNSAINIIDDSDVKVDSDTKTVRFNIELASCRTAVVLIK